MMIGLAFPGQTADLRMDALACAHVDAPGRLIDDEDIGVRQQPAADEHLLLIAAGEVLIGVSISGVLVRSFRYNLPCPCASAGG